MDKIRILVVDDESRMRKLVRDFLVREGYEVLEAGDGEEALDLFYREKDPQGVQFADHHADGEGRGERRAERI